MEKKKFSKSLLPISFLSTFYYRCKFIAYKNREIFFSGSNISEVDIGAIEASEENQERKDTHKKCPKALSFVLNVGKKIVLNPNTYASIAGLVWSLISYR